MNKRRIIKFVSSDERCKISGKEFLIAMLNAGKRNINNKIIFQESLKRQDEIDAIDKYIGYDCKKDFGLQESNARMLAMQDIKPVKAQAFKRSLIPPYITGYVKGANDVIAKKRDHLLASMERCLDNQAKNLAVIQDKKASIEEKLLHQGLYEIECERQKNIKKEIDELRII